MSVMLNVFRKPVDLQTVYTSWNDAPVFRGKTRRDGPVDVWLERIKEGCKARKVPKAMWHLVGEHYLHSKAKKRFKAVQLVMANRYGGKYVWDWKRFKIAMTNMHWDLDSNLVQTFLVRALDNVAWILGPSTASSASKKENEEKVYVAIEKLDQPSFLKAFKNITNSSFLSGNKESSLDDEPVLISSEEVKEAKQALKNAKSPPKAAKPPPKDASASSKGSKIMSKVSKDSKATSKESMPGTKTDKKTPARSLAPSKPSKITWKEPHKMLVKRNPAEKDPADVSYSQAPMWLLQVCHVLDNASPNAQGVMTILSAILITVGSIPALPVVQSGAAGVFLASGAAQTIGSILTGFGAWLGMHADQDQHEHHHHGHGGSHK